MVLSWKHSSLAKIEVITHVSAESQTSIGISILTKPRVRLESRRVFWIVRPHGVISLQMSRPGFHHHSQSCLSPRTTDQALALRSAVCCRDSSKATSGRPSYTWEKAGRPMLAIYFLGGCYKVLISLGNNKTFSWQPKILPKNDHGPGCQCFWCSGPNPNSGLI